MLEANMLQTVYSVSPHPRHFNLNLFLLDSGLIDTLPGNLEGRANVRLGELRTILHNLELKPIASNKL